MNNFIKSQGIDLFVVTGDNYYPNTFKKNEQKFKEWNQKNLEFGFTNCLHKINFTKNYILGNHDLLDNNPVYIVEKLFKNETIDSSNYNFDCPVIKTQKNIIESNNDRFIFPFKTESKIHNNKKIDIVYINTDIYHILDSLNKYLITNEEEFEETKILDNIKCIMDVVNSEKQIELTKLNKKTYLDHLIKQQNQLIIDSFKKNPDYLIIIGHEPIISAKIKNQKDKLSKHEQLLQLFSSIDITNNKTIYYLCADTHLYQEGIIKIQLENGSILTIHQQISGTGGAKLDNLPSKTEWKKNNISYSINKQRKQHGFSTFSIDTINNEIKTNFYSKII